MRILQVCSATDIGGGEVHVAGLSRSLATRGHQVHIAVRPNSPLRAALQDQDISWHELPLRNSLDVESARGIARLANQHKLDLVHAHVGRDYLIAAMACRRAPRVKLVLTRHHYLPLKRNAIYKWLLKDVGAVIAVSNSVKESVIERLALSQERIKVIPNWVDPERFQTIDRDAARATFRLKSKLSAACIGQITQTKGVEEFVKAAGRVARSRQDVEFLIVGEEQAAQAPFTAHLNELIESLGIKERLRFLGHVNEIPELLSAVDVVVVPSWDEGFSLVTIEALAAGCAVIASDVGGIRDIIRENVTGMLFPPRDSNSLANKLLWALSDSTLRERLGKEGRRDTFARYSRDKVIDKIERLYFEVMGVVQDQP